MKYMLLMQFKMAGWDSNHMGTWAPEDIKGNMEFMKRFNKQLADAGELVSVEGLGGPEGLRVVQAQKGGKPTITDGPFPESKEFLAGYWVIDVDTAERAYDIASQLSTLPGRGGVPANLPIEVRPLMTAPKREV